MKAKKIIYKYALMILFAVGIGSCNFLDVVPDNIATLDNAFTDRYNAEKFLAQCYSGMPQLATIGDNPAILGGLETTMNEENQNNNGMLYALGFSTVTSNYIDIWGWAYNSINDCNIFLENIDKVPDLTASEKARWTGEVKIIKAYIHFYLLKFYGPIPMLKVNIPVGEETQGVRVYREKVDTVFEYILELLNEVEESDALPTIITTTATELGRFTSPALAMLKAKVLLTWASPFYNGNTDYNTFFDHNGEHFFNQTPDPQRWVNAQTAIENAIALCKDAGIRLYQKDDYKVGGAKMSDTTLLVQTLRSSITERWNPELVFGQSRSLVTQTLQELCLTRFEQSTYSYPTARLSATFDLVEKFYSGNGVPISEDINFDYENRYLTQNGDDQHKYYIKVGEINAKLNFNREPRFYSSIGFNRGLWYGNTYKQSADTDLDALCPLNYLGEASSQAQPGECNATGYFVKKLVSTNTMFTAPASFSWENYPFPEMRYADLLLMYAEVLNEVKSAPDAEVYAPIDEVRERAGLEGVVDSWAKYSRAATKPSNKDGMREIIHQERAIELAFEGHRLWDLIRWKKGTKELSREIKMWNVLEEKPADYWVVSTLYKRDYTLKDYLAPIPEYDIIKNPQLIQNPGW